MLSRLLVRDRPAEIAIVLEDSGSMAIADAGEVMPPKSTWFEPKLADGLVSHVLD